MLETQRTAAENKAIYLKNYSIGYQLPTEYIIGAKLDKKDPSFVYLAVKHVFPEEDFDLCIHEQGKKNRHVFHNEVNK